MSVQEVGSMPLKCDERERSHEPPEWEPEPLELPIEGPFAPGGGRRDDNTPVDGEFRVIVIDLA
jgi:hypothetical protein